MSRARDERRGAGRRKMLRTGIAIYGDIAEQMRCAVLDMSESSAKLKPETHGVLPDRFTLRLQADEAYDCTVVRRSGFLLAVRLTRKPGRG